MGFEQTIKPKIGTNNEPRKNVRQQNLKFLMGIWNYKTKEFN